MTVKEAAALLEVSVTTVYGLCQTGQLGHLLDEPVLSQLPQVMAGQPGALAQGTRKRRGVRRAVPQLRLDPQPHRLRQQPQRLQVKQPARRLIRVSHACKYRFASMACKHMLVTEVSYARTLKSGRRMSGTRRGMSRHAGSAGLGARLAIDIGARIAVEKGCRRNEQAGDGGALERDPQMRSRS